MPQTIYTMKQACAATGLSYDTLKFYCNAGLVSGVQRDQNNRRIFDAQDLAWINSLRCLKSCGMSIAEMKQYLNLCLLGEQSIPERQAMLDQKLSALQQKLAEVEQNIAFIKHKQQFFQDVLAGKRQYYSNLIKPQNSEHE